MVVIVARPVDDQIQHGTLPRKMNTCRSRALVCIKRGPTKASFKTTSRMQGAPYTVGFSQTSMMIIPRKPAPTPPQLFRHLTPQICQPSAAGSFHRKDISPMPLTFREVSASKLDKPLRLLCYGDSLTIGFFNSGKNFEPYGKTLAKVLSSLGVPCEVLVCGLSGLTAQELYTKANKRTLRDVVGCQGMGLCEILNDKEPVDMVLIMAGTNDLGQSQTAATIFEYVRGLHGICHANNIPTVALAPPSVRKMPSTRKQQRQELASLISKWASSTPGVVWTADVDGILPQNETNFTLWDTDGLHFSVRGSQLLGAVIAQRISRIANTGYGNFVA